MSTKQWVKRCCVFICFSPIMIPIWQNCEGGSQSALTYFYPNFFSFYQITYLLVDDFEWKGVRSFSLSTVNNPLHHNTVNCTSMYISLKSLTLALIFLLRSRHCQTSLLKFWPAVSVSTCTKLNSCLPPPSYPKTSPLPNTVKASSSIHSSCLEVILDTHTILDQS